MIRDLVRLALAAALVVFVLLGYTTLRIWQQGNRDEVRPADALVVLGAAEYDGRPSPILEARLDHALALFLTGDYRYLVVTGGKDPGDATTEAAVERAYAISQGVPTDRILVEDRGRTTLESMQAVSRLLSDRGLHDAVFVSDRAHMLRVLRMASDLGMKAWGSPTARSPIDKDPGLRARAYAHELAALAYYFVLGGAPPDELQQTP